MRKARNIILLLSAAFAGMMLTVSCPVLGEGINPVGGIPDIQRKQTRTTIGNPNPHFVQTILHVDLERYNPLNALDFFFGWQLPDGTWYDPQPFFEHVVFGHSYLDRDERGNVILRLTPALQYILNNSNTYIKPLTLSGIKVLIEVRSGNFADDEPGIGVGLGALDMPAVQLFTPQLQALVDRFGIDGFEFNDIGGGYLAYPPFTRNLKRFRSNEPMYPDEMFKDAGGDWLSDAEIEQILWMEGGANFTDIIVYVNEHLKERRRVAADFGGGQEDGRTVTIVRSLAARRDTGHGRFMRTETRPEFTPDAYTGATTFVLWNMIAFVNGVRNEMQGTAEDGYPFLVMWHAATQETVSQEQIYFSPFIIDLSLGPNRPAASAAQALGDAFAGTQTLPNRFGTLYFSNLPTTGEDPNIATFLTNFSSRIFGQPVRLHEGGGNHPRPQW